MRAQVHVRVRPVIGRIDGADPGSLKLHLDKRSGQVQIPSDGGRRPKAYKMTNVFTPEASACARVPTRRQKHRADSVGAHDTPRWLSWRLSQEGHGVCGTWVRRARRGLPLP